MFDLLCCSRQFLYPSYGGFFDVKSSIPLEHYFSFGWYFPLKIWAFDNPQTVNADVFLAVVQFHLIFLFHFRQRQATAGNISAFAG